MMRKKPRILTVSLNVLLSIADQTRQAKCEKISRGKMDEHQRIRQHKPFNPNTAWVKSQKKIKKTMVRLNNLSKAERLFVHQLHFFFCFILWKCLLFFGRAVPRQSRLPIIKRQKESTDIVCTVALLSRTCEYCLRSPMTSHIISGDI
jgi:hypothetical protein